MKCDINHIKDQWSLHSVNKITCHRTRPGTDDCDLMSQYGPPTYLNCCSLFSIHWYEKDFNCCQSKRNKHACN